MNLLTAADFNGIMASYTYNGNGYMTKKKVGNNETTISYNNYDLPTSYETKVGDKVLGSFKYTYSVDGNRISENDTVNNISKAYEYDGAGRLVKETQSGAENRISSFTYDLRGNRTKETVTGDENYVMTNTYDANNRLTNQSKTVDGSAAENVKYYYDANGNQTFKQTYNYSQGGLMSVKSGSYQSGTVESFTYNLQNQLTGYQSNKKKASYAYGADGLRKSKTVNNVMMKYVWDRGNLAAEVSGSTIVNMYDYGPDGITSKETSNGDKTLYLKNAHGDVVGMSDTNGNVSANYRYDAFGNVLSESIPDRFGYCGEFFDNESGLVYLRNRYYDSTTGRFITEDPVKAGLNWYVYAENNPIIFIDPNGLDSYILYTTNEGSDFSEQANWQKEHLESQGERVIMREVNDYDSFIFEWNMIGYDYDIGENVSVNKVIIYCHGNDRTLILEDGSATKALSIDGKNSSGFPIGNLSYLEYKYVNELHILACNAGNLDPYFAGVGNVASIMSQKISGVTYAYDGNVSFGRPIWQLWGEDIGMSSRLSTTQYSFNEIVAYYGKAGRTPKGKLTYYNGEYKSYGYYPNTSIQ